MKEDWETRRENTPEEGVDISRGKTGGQTGPRLAGKIEGLSKRREGRGGKYGCDFVRGWARESKGYACGIEGKEIITENKKKNNNKKNNITGRLVWIHYFI